MARTCQADDALEKQFEALLKQQAGPEVGLLVGKHAAGAKAVLYGTIRTPSQEGVEPIQVSAGAAHPVGRRRAGAAASGGGASVSLDVDWITEHARQVARMLPGGLSVLGLYVFCPDAAYAGAATQLCGLLAGMADFCLPPPADSADAPSGGGDALLLLLHLDSTSRKQALRALPVSSAAAATSVAPSSSSPAAPAPASASSLRPVELRFGPTLGSLVLLRCWHGMDLELTVTAPGPGSAMAVPGGGGEAGTGAGARAQLRRQLAALVAAEGERIRNGVFVSTGGAVPAESAPVAEAMPPAAPSATSCGPLRVPTFDLTFLAPPRFRELQPPSAEAPSPLPSSQQTQTDQQRAVAGPAVAGQARLRGCLQGLAVVGKREAMGRALAELKADLLASLAARLELIVEEATRSWEQQQQPPERQQRPDDIPAHPLLCSPAQLMAGDGCEVALPRRVLLPWLGGNVALCDYLMEGEAADAAAERAQELLALQPEGGAGRGGVGEGIQVVELEMRAAASAAEGPWQPNAVPGRDVISRQAPGSAALASLSSRLSCGATMAASVAVAAVASAVGLLSLLGQPARLQGPQ